MERLHGLLTNEDVGDRPSHSVEFTITVIPSVSLKRASSSAVITAELTTNDIACTEKPDTSQSHKQH